MRPSCRCGNPGSTGCGCSAAQAGDLLARHGFGNGNGGRERVGRKRVGCERVGLPRDPGGHGSTHLGVGGER